MTVDTFRTQVVAIPEIVQCYMLMGDIDFLILVITEDLGCLPSAAQRQVVAYSGSEGHRLPCCHR
jgi:DNA-binding Lrp family transcriptional regulator